VIIEDCHVHLYPPELNSAPAAWAAAQGEPHWARLCTRRRRDGRPVQGFPSVDDLLRELDAAGVARAVLLGWYWEKPDTCAWQNRFLAACARAHPDRLTAFATVQPAAGEVVCRSELERARDEGCRGLGELSPHSQGVDVDDPGLSRVLETAAAWGWPVNLHVTDPASRPYPGRVETPLPDFLALARRHPRTKFILAHWGGLLPLSPRAAGGLPDNLWFDTAASPLLYEAEIWQRAGTAVPHGRLLFGSDHPLALYPREPDGGGLVRFVAEARAGGADAAVLGGNLRQLLPSAPA
jgi:predicted TIM-barrel fold metal-dependent hydrolase